MVNLSPQKSLLTFQLRSTKMPNKPYRNKSKQRGIGKVNGPGNLTRGKGAFASLSANVENWMPLFPARVTKDLRYSTHLQLSSTAGAVVTYVFGANDLYDPDHTGTGHQPMGFDQMCVQYEHFTVTSATIRCVFKGVSASKMTVCIRQDAGSTPVTVIDQIVEMGGCVTDYIDDSNTSGDIKMLSLSLDVAKMQGMTHKEIIADPTLRGSAGSSPTEICYFHVQVWDAAAQTGSVNVDVIMEQRAIFSEPRTQTESLVRLREFGNKPPLETKVPQLSKEDKSFVHVCCR